MWKGETLGFVRVQGNKKWLLLLLLLFLLLLAWNGFVHVLLDPSNPTKEHTRKNSLSLSLFTWVSWLWSQVLGLLTRLFPKQWILALTVYHILNKLNSSPPPPPLPAFHFQSFYLLHIFLYSNFIFFKSKFFHLKKIKTVYFLSLRL